MTRFLVRLFAPRGRIDFVVKWVLQIIACCLLYAAIETLVNGYPSEGFRDHFKTVVLTSAPFFALALWLFGHMYVLQVELAELATKDMLTGLPNRRAFMEKAGRASKDPGGVLMMVDVDHFKRINDTYGHATGDMVLQTLADHMVTVIRAQDTVARIGGEEFAIYLKDAPVGVVQEIGTRLSQGVMVPTADGEERVTVSVGASVADGVRAIDRLLSEADEALYAAKSQGRACLVMAVCDAGSHVF